MKHKILSIIGAGLLLLTLGACREQSDTLVSYVQGVVEWSEPELCTVGL